MKSKKKVTNKNRKNLLQRQNINNQINSRLTPATALKIGTFALIPNFATQREISEKTTNHSEKNPMINTMM